MIDLSPAPDATFLLLGERKLLFSEGRQQLFELNDIAALIWCLLEDGKGVPAIEIELVERGLGSREAQTFIASVAADWARSGLATMRQQGASELRDTSGVEIQLSLPNSAVLVRIRGEGVSRLILPAFAHLEGTDKPKLAPIDLSEREEAIEFAQGGRVLDMCRENEIVASLKAHLTGEILARSSPDLVLHAASLVHDLQSLLMVGRPGAGKSTLTLALAASGFGYAGDDIALFASNGSVRGVPFAAAAKAGSWGLVSRFVPDFETLPVHRRADRKRVKYVVPGSLVAQANRPVGWLVFLRRRAGVHAKLTEIDPATALTRLIGHAYVTGGKLTKAGVQALAAALRGARIWDFDYCDLDEAVAVMRDACHGA